MFLFLISHCKVVFLRKVYIPGVIFPINEKQSSKWNSSRGSVMNPEEFLSKLYNLYGKVAKSVAEHQTGGQEVGPSDCDFNTLEKAVIELEDAQRAIKSHKFELAALFIRDANLYLRSMFSGRQIRNGFHNSENDLIHELYVVHENILPIVSRIKSLEYDPAIVNYAGLRRLFNVYNQAKEKLKVA
jgi:hypothetical protein